MTAAGSWAPKPRTLKISGEAYRRLAEAKDIMETAFDRQVTYSEVIERLCALRERTETGR